MKQFILAAAPDHAGRVALTGKDYHYLVRVRRLQAGGLCPLLLPSGGRALARVLSLDSEKIVLEIQEALSAPAERNTPTLVLFQALPRGAKMDVIVRQAAECGAARIVPFIAEYSVSRPKAAERSAQASRWQRIVREARQQSGSLIPTEICPPLSLEGVFEIWEELRGRDAAGTRGILLDSSPLAKCAMHEYLKERVTLAALAAGPEGGFSQAEMEAFAARGFKPLSLGGTVLRAETASIGALAAVRLLLLEKDSWIHIAKE